MGLLILNCNLHFIFFNFSLQLLKKYNYILFQFNLIQTISCSFEKLENEDGHISVGVKKNVSD